MISVAGGTVHNMQGLRHAKTLAQRRQLVPRRDRRPGLRRPRQQVREVEQLNLLFPTTLLLDYMILKKLLDVRAKRPPVFLRKLFKLGL